MSQLNKIAISILSNGKGILAADESNGTMTKRLESVKNKNNIETPQPVLVFRKKMFVTTKGHRDSAAYGLCPFILKENLCEKKKDIEKNLIITFDRKKTEKKN